MAILFRIILCLLCNVRNEGASFDEGVGDAPHGSYTQKPCHHCHSLFPNNPHTQIDVKNVSSWNTALTACSFAVLEFVVVKNLHSQNTHKHSSTVSSTGTGYDSHSLGDWA